MVRIESWSMVSDADSYRAPEQRNPRLRGYVFGHPRHSDGTRVTTSSIVQVYGVNVLTSSGTHYCLGQPEYEYAAFCLRLGKPIDPHQPIKVKK